MNDRTRKAVKDIEDNSTWSSFYYVLRAVYPALCALTLADSNTPGMDKCIIIQTR